MSAVVIAFGTAVAGTPLGAQERSIPAVGEQVRVVAPSVGPRAVTGDLVAVRGDTLIVRGDAATVAVPLGQVEWIQVRRPRSRAAGWGRGLLIGMPAGFASGYLVGRVLEGSHERCGDDCGLVTGFGALAGLATGTVLGTIIGISTPGSGWVEGHRPTSAIALFARPVAVRGGRSLALALSIPTP